MLPTPTAMPLAATTGLQVQLGDDEEREARRADVELGQAGPSKLLQGEAGPSKLLLNPQKTPKTEEVLPLLPSS